VDGEGLSGGGRSGAGVTAAPSRQQADGLPEVRAVRQAIGVVLTAA